MASKTFKIGEYVLGGTIKVDATPKRIVVTFIDMFNGKELKMMTCPVEERNGERLLDEFLTENGTSYYADKVMTWIKSKVKLNNFNY